MSEVCTFGDHPGIIGASRDYIANHPELRIGQMMKGQWVSSLMLCLYCCPAAVCEQVEYTQGFGFPAVHHPDTGCMKHEERT